MIQIRSEAGDLLRALPLDHGNPDAETVHYNRTFGFVRSGSMESRLRMRKSHGLRIAQDGAPNFSFKVKKTPTGVSVFDSQGCNVKATDDLSWMLEAPGANYRIYLVDATTTTPLPVQIREEKESKIWNLLPLLLFLLIAGGVFMIPKDQIAKIEEQAPIPPPVMVQLQPKQVVPVEQPKPEPKVQKNQALDKQAKVKKALTQTLGFLKMMGRKDLKKAIGGLPTNVPEASAGAGPGGNEGSGGQLLQGLGKGLRHTTVGNTGTAGLGGIGTKGAGGGLGGYGDTDYGSGAGQSLSTIPLAQDAVIEGGLDRSLIQATIMRYLSQVRACYEEGLKQKADLIGQVTMAFEISGIGGVNYSHVQRSSLGDRGVEECISKRMMNWKFPTPRGGVNVKVSYPFMLRPVRS